MQNQLQSLTYTVISLINSNSGFLSVLFARAFILNISKPSMYFVQFLLEGYDKKTSALPTFCFLYLFFLSPMNCQGPLGKQATSGEQGLINL